MASADNMSIDIDLMQQKLEDEKYSRVVQSLREVGFRSVFELLATYCGRQQDLSSWLTWAPINRDRNLRLQYLAGWGLHTGKSVSLLNLLWSNFRFPADVFRGSPSNLRLLEKSLSGN